MSGQDFGPRMPPPPQQHYYGEEQPPSKKPASGLAIAGFILSIVGITALIGVILSIIGIATTGPASQRGGRGLAIAGLIVGVVWLAVAGLVIGWAVRAGTVMVDVMSEDFPKVYMYAMEKRAESFKKVTGRYPQSKDEFWSNDVYDLELQDRQSSSNIDLGSYRKLIRYEATPGSPRPYRIFHRSLMDESGLEFEHNYGADPRPELARRLEGIPMIGKDARAAFLRLADAIIDMASTPPATPGSWPAATPEG